MAKEEKRLTYYQKEELRLKREQMDWTKIQVVMTMFLTMVILLYTMLSFAKQYPDLPSSLEVTISLIVTAIVFWFIFIRNIEKKK